MSERLNPDDKPIYEALREAGAPELLAYTAVQRIRDVAAANIIAQVMAKLDAQNAKLDTKLDAQNAKLDAISDAQNAKLDAISDAQESRLRMLMWMIGAAVALIGIFVRLWG